MAIMFGVSNPKDYLMVRETGCAVIWDGDPVRHVNGVFHLVRPEKLVENLLPCVVGFLLGDDIPVSKLPEVEAKARELDGHYPGMTFPVLVSAIYTRLLQHLEVESYEEYLRAFKELAPMLTPMLCHYPVREPETDACAPLGFREDYFKNLALMRKHFSRWWSWVQVTAHELYEWHFRQCTLAEVLLQIKAAQYYGATMWGYFLWDDFGEHPGIGRDSSVVTEANRLLR